MKEKIWYQRDVPVGLIINYVTQTRPGVAYLRFMLKCLCSNSGVSFSNHKDRM